MADRSEAPECEYRRLRKIGVARTDGCDEVDVRFGHRVEQGNHAHERRCPAKTISQWRAPNFP